MPNPSRKRHWLRRPSLRLSVRAMMGLVLLVAAGLGWVIHLARVQREAVAAIELAGGQVSYDTEQQQMGPLSRMTRFRRWLVARLGRDLVDNVDYVLLNSIDEHFNEINTFEKADRIMEQIGRLPHVAELDFEFCYALRDSGLRGLSGLRRLRKLDLRSTGVQGPGLMHLKSMSRLEELNLYGLPLSDADLTPLAGLSSLKKLDLEDTPVTDAGLAHLKELTNLEVLDLANTSVTGTGLVQLKDLKHLVLLSLNSCRIVTLEGVENLTALEFLIVGTTPVDDACVVKLAVLPKLRIVDFADSRVGDAGVASLARLRNLTCLRLDGTRVTDAGLAYLSGKTSLYQLSLDRTAITDAGLEHLVGLSGLRELSIVGTRVTPAGYAKLKRSLPRMKSLRHFNNPPHWSTP